MSSRRKSPQRSAAGGAGLISPLPALGAQVEELDPAGGERGREKEGGRKGVGKERKGKAPPSLSLSSSLTFSFPARLCFAAGVTTSQKRSLTSQIAVFASHISHRKDSLAICTSMRYLPRMCQRP